MNAPTAFREAVERWDIDAVRELLAPDIEFHSPATFHPFVGRETVGDLLKIVGQTIEGIDLLRMDEDGLIADFTVMLRPISGLLPFAQAMGEKVAAAGLQTTRV